MFFDFFSFYELQGYGYANQFDKKRNTEDNRIFIPFAKIYLSRVKYSNEIEYKFENFENKRQQLFSLFFVK